MKLTDIDIAFVPGMRPHVKVKFDKPISQADPIYVAGREKQYDVWVYRGEDGDYVHCGVEQKPKQTMLKTNRVRMHDGWHTTYELQPTNAVAVNAMLRMMDPVMDVVIDDPERGLISGHVDVAAVAKLLYARYSGQQADVEAPAMACIEWPSGIRVYEPVVALWDGQSQWKAEANRPEDKIVWLCTPDDKLTPILRAVQAMENQPTNGIDNPTRPL